MCRNARLITGIDGCGMLTYAFPLREVARAYAILADPGRSRPDPRVALAQHLYDVRDAMLAHPELVAGTRDRLDTSLMKAAPGRVVARAAWRPCGASASWPAHAGRGRRHPEWPSRSKTETVRARHVGRDRRGAPPGRGRRGPGAPRASPGITAAGSLDPHGRTGAEAVPEFELAPVGELIG